ncbi:interleukin-6 receptor subunit beta-like [Polypterus senegalus]|uniref:interleukin-6 receptor subunit beta-like n=1 Tax=Polypterus senegalus TaxID=55291 RepID=UPI0019630A4B|nr:interleukin-6 receptor subunit beta-like [Polypterus senegalus]
MKWEMAHDQHINGYNISITRGTEHANYSTRYREFFLIISGSAYAISITAFNNKGRSPATTAHVQELENIVYSGEMNITAKKPSQFQISWSSSQTKCYAFDWGPVKGNRTSNSWFLNTPSLKLDGEFEAYKRYRIIMYLRYIKPPCNLKDFNDTERTFAVKDVYITEGTPLYGPSNVSVSDIKSTSALLTWSEIPEESLQGFLQGYAIHYSSNSTMDSSQAVYVNSSTLSWTLTDLRSNTLYTVQISAFTSAGEGKQSEGYVFVTLKEVPARIYFTMIGILVLLITFIVIYCQRFEKVKKAFWPHIPSPENSSAIQEIDKTNPARLAERSILPVAELELDTSDSGSIHIIEEASEITRIYDSAKNNQSVDQEVLVQDAEGLIVADQVEPDHMNAFSKMTGLSFKTASDYTTMELFHQAMPHFSQVDQETQNKEEHTACDMRQDYVKQKQCYMNHADSVHSHSHSLLTEPYYGHATPL